MTQYAIQRAVFDFVRHGGEPPCACSAPLHHALDAEEEAALRRRDLRALARLGVHPVLINGFARATGRTREAYRSQLTDVQAESAFRQSEGRPRWRAS